MALFLGIDGGGTTTTCVLGDELRVLARATSGGSNVVRLGEAVAREHLRESVLAACAGAGVTVTEIEQVCAGVAGASLPAIGAVVHDILANLFSPSARVEVLGDMETALESALSSAPGVMVISGTGSIAFGRNERGRTARAGGWGWAISDEGSGHCIGRAAVAAMVRAHDNGEPTALTSAILREWGVKDLSEAVQVANASPGPDYARLFPAILAAVQDADAPAGRVLDEAGEQLAGLASVVIRRLWMPGQHVRVAIGGSVLRHAAAVRQAFFSHLRRECPEACVSFGHVDAAEGALSLARKGAESGSGRVC
jgi:N-acetylglucosamine kinase-like BadF-type ATPase